MVAGDGDGDDGGDNGSRFLGPAMHQGHVPRQLTLSHPGRRAPLLAPSWNENVDHKTAKSHPPPSHTGSGTHLLALESKFSPPHPTVPLWTQTEICTCLNRPGATLPLRRHSAGSMPASAGRVCVHHPLSGADSVNSGPPPPPPGTTLCTTHSEWTDGRESPFGTGGLSTD